MPQMNYGAYTGPSCWEKMKLGFKIGCGVGVVSGTLFSGYAAFRYGWRGKELVTNVGKAIIQGGGTFGTFLAVGSALKC